MNMEKILYWFGANMTHYCIAKSIQDKIGFSQIEISYINSKPIVKIKKIKKKYKFIISISHENNFAIAVVISENIK